MVVRVDITRFEVEKLLRQYVEERLSVDMENEECFITVVPSPEPNLGAYTLTFFLKSGE